MITIAIDGPTGAGKSTIAKTLAQRLGFLYLDTGACYRSIAYWCLKNDVDIDNEEAILKMLGDINLSIKHQDGVQHIYINKEDVTDFIRTPEVSENTSKIAVMGGVRDWLVELQRSVARESNVIMDGRDIGTVIMPDAQVKIFLTADASARAQRRHAEYLAKGDEIGYNYVLEDLVKRDERDSSRKIAPLAKADDAVEVDTTTLDFDQTVETLLKIINDRIN